MGTGPTTFERAAALLFLVAGLLHASAAPQHFVEWWGYGAFFAVAAVAQALFGLLLLTHGIAKPPWETVRRTAYGAGILGNLAILALWAVTRTTGIPAGPNVGELEPVGVLDGATKITELAGVVLLALALRDAPRGPQADPRLDRPA